MKDKVELIKAEIERLRKIFQLKYQQLGIDDKMSLVVCGKRNLCNDLISFINSLSEEVVSEELEEAAYDYCDEVNHRQTYLITDAFNAGAKWQKEKMMSQAIDGLVICDKELTQGYKDIVFAMPKELKVDDKVKLIIIKED